MQLAKDRILRVKKSHPPFRNPCLAFDQPLPVYFPEYESKRAGFVKGIAFGFACIINRNDDIDAFVALQVNIDVAYPGVKFFYLKVFAGFLYRIYPLNAGCGTVPRERGLLISYNRVNGVQIRHGADIKGARCLNYGVDNIYDTFTHRRRIDSRFNHWRPGASHCIRLYENYGHNKAGTKDS